MTRTATRTLATHSPGAGWWRASHERKTPWSLFCEALLAERAMHRTHQANGVFVRGGRHAIYPCRYGSHYLIESAPLHWHVGRTPDKLT